MGERLVHRMIQRLALATLAVVLGACAAPGTPLPELARVPAAFEMSARLSVRQADRSDIARLRWIHQPDSDVWIISSPLGNEVARIESNAAGARLLPAGGPAEEAANFEALTQRLLGVSLDPALLGAWLHGNAHPATPDGWQVSLDEMQRAGAVVLARRITATSGDVVVKLVVDDYRAI